ncbi:MAG: HAMP domain-containing sensor histidine kinase [Veillonellaceae bacterium]|nr:HAMP domain-containing sensor histidine kinase [Veillonellaceae bacterium]
MHLRWFRNVPLGKRLIAMAFVLTFLPMLVLTMLGGLIFAGLNYLGSGWESWAMQLWPKTAPIAVHFALGRIRDVADRPVFNFHEMQEQCWLLEGSGISVLVRQDGQDVYCSDGAEPAVIEAATLGKTGAGHSALVWDDSGFAYTYRTDRIEGSSVEVYAAGDVPIKQSPLTEAQREVQRQGRFLLYVIFGAGLLAALLLGVAFARILTHQVLRPLAVMRRSAAAIEHGDYDVPAVPEGTQAQDDEIGETCRSFDDMRRGLRAAREERERYERNRKELLAGISHDLRTPLTALRGYASGILDGIARTEEKRTHYVTQIYRSSEILQHLVENLFLFSKLDLGRVAFNQATVDLRAYFADFVAERAPWYEDQGLVLHLESSDDTEPLPVRLDPQEFQRVVENILGNSRKYGGGQPSVDISIEKGEETESAGGRTAVVRFADHGPGVPEAELGKLFESFYRTDKARSQTAKGSGLGLAIARGIVEGMGGRIHAETTAGGGLTVVLSFPVLQAEKGKENVE